MDPMQPKQASSAGIVIVAAVIALLVGFAGGKLMNRKDTTATAMMPAAAVTPSASNKAADLRSALVTLGVEHMHLTDSAIDAALDGTPDAAALKDSLVANGTSISAAVGSVYGADARAQFQTLWNNHLNDFVTYAVADKKGDAAAKKAALDDIATNYTKPISALLSGANPNLPDATLQTVFGDHVSMTAAIIDDHVAGNYAKEATDLTAADTHIGVIMSTLAGAIVTQYPAKF